MALETELHHYQSIKDELLAHHEGKYALIIGTDLLGAFDDAEAAYAHGVEKRGNVPMLIKQVLRDEPAESLPAMVLGLIGAHL